MVCLFLKIYHGLHLIMVYIQVHVHVHVQVHIHIHVQHNYHVGHVLYIINLILLFYLLVFSSV